MPKHTDYDQSLLPIVSFQFVLFSFLLTHKLHNGFIHSILFVCYSLDEIQTQVVTGDKLKCMLRPGVNITASWLTIYNRITENSSPWILLISVPREHNGRISETAVNRPQYLGMWGEKQDLYDWSYNEISFKTVSISTSIWHNLPLLP